MINIKLIEKEEGQETQENNKEKTEINQNK